MGLWKGKKGSTVFYQIANSNSKQKQGMRERNYEPSNPQSYGQAGQRMKMYPAQAVYGALKSTIERSWQGVKYGQMTRQAFLKTALRESLFPAVVKGTNGAVPGPYIIAKGTLPEITGVTFGSDQITLSLFSDFTDENTTIGELTEQLLSLNPFLKEGDQISITYCVSDFNGDSFIWGVQSFVLDTNNTSAIISLSQNAVVLNFTGSGIEVTPNGDRLLYAAACIISRDEPTPLRSTARLVLRYEHLGQWYDASAVEAARKSYQKREYVRDTDWPVDPDGEGVEPVVQTWTYNGAPVTIGLNGEPVTPDDTGGTVTGGGTFEQGVLVSFDAQPKGQYRFDGLYASRENAIAGTNKVFDGSSTPGEGRILTFASGSMASGTYYGRFVIEETP